MAKPDVIQQAQAILNIDPLPADAEQQLRDLENQANEFEALEFPMIWEGYVVRQAQYGEVEEK